MWVRSWISRRLDSGFFAQLVKELHSEDMNSYANFLRMSNKDYEYLLQKVEPLITKQDTHLRLAISPSERLMLTLRFLATGDIYHSLQYLFRIPVTTISRIIPEVCEAIFTLLKTDYLQVSNFRKTA
ncbi:unnamed protein product [Acanthoscelides obtectus]|uniref:Nuclease HARBI1 n=1 Tax=Acanthoscelides obtectus TaxID=200917 RepID=A0A9P0M1X3_ACAOB|nr:unnamed protein product [Acanthoscelides obtectus]CAK1625070.1 hypothetical protein AOBTE_LOCUS2929 [Acanthoscelides obtectus]